MTQNIEKCKKYKVMDSLWPLVVQYKKDKLNVTKIMSRYNSKDKVYGHLLQTKM